MFPAFEPQLRAATTAVGANMADMCYHYHGEFVADRAAIQQAVERHGHAMRDVLIPGLEEANDAPMGHALERLWVSIFSPAVPRRIWILWEQGWDNAPYLQQQVSATYPKPNLVGQPMTLSMSR